MTGVDLAHVIPNNVGLAEKPALAATLRAFREDFLGWWGEMGPEGFDSSRVWLRTPAGVDSKGWASYGYVPLADYRWGLFQAAPEPGERASFGALAGKTKTADIPDGFREAMIKLLVTQGDTEPGSVEQSRRLGRIAPSLYDLRNLFQFHVEEGRHLWAMVHLLDEHFGKDGTHESEGLLARRSGDAENPRILQAFNSPIIEWLSFFFWCTLADRDGKYQLLAMSESGFDPLARTCRFMLFEEAHHMFMGDDGLRRVLQRTAKLMIEHDTDDVAPHGGVNLATFQRYLNYWAPQTIDLFGNEVSDWAERLFDAGIKGRAYESIRYGEHVRLDDPVSIALPVGGPSGGEEGRLETRELPQRRVLNELLRRDYLAELGTTVRRWNRMLKKRGIDQQIALPDSRFNRRIGAYKNTYYTPCGRPISEAEYRQGLRDWLPGDAEREHIQSLMAPVTAPGKVAGWIAPPARGINGKPLDFAYVKL